MTTLIARLRSLLLLLFLSGTLGLVVCNSDTPAYAKSSAQTDAAAQDQSRLIRELFSQRPTSVQPRNTPLTLRFRQPVINAEQVGSSADQYLNLSPKVAGKAQFDTTSSIAFVPDVPLTSGQDYILKVAPNGLLNIPANTPTVTFAFKTAPLELEVQTAGLEPVADQPTQMQLSGKVFTSDFVAPDALEKSLRATTQNKSLGIVWEHNDTGTEHRFTVSAIPRETFATDLRLSWDGKSLNTRGASSSGQRDFAIPSQQTFSITRIDTLSEDEEGKSHVSISFSDALDAQQDLNGLVQLGSGEVRTQIVGNRLLVYPNGTLGAGKHKLIIHAGIKAASVTLGKLTERTEQAITLEPPKPAVRFVGRGNILPDKQTMEIPLEARGVNAVQITAAPVRGGNRHSLNRDGR